MEREPRPPTLRETETEGCSRDCSGKWHVTRAKEPLRYLPEQETNKLIR